jgi:endo-1,4-beta-xylanase
MLENHVTNEVAHWAGQCYAWDVVNEGLNEDGTYRNTIFYQMLGEDYLKIAFAAAAKADPKAKLYYNDYNLEWPSAKTAGAARIVKLLQDAGIKIDGVGLQAHHVLPRNPSLDEQIAAIQEFAALGVEVAITELDVRIPLPTNETNLEQQKQAYKNTVGACAQVKACVGVTVWDFYDPVSEFPCRCEL